MTTTINLGRGQVLLGNYLIDAFDVEIKPRQADFELFESYSGIISIRKMLDKHTEVSMKCLLTEKTAPNYNPDVQEKNRKDFVKLRKEFLDDINGETILVVSEMFKPFQGIVEAKEYSISEGETAAEYKLTIKEISGGSG